jgi:hypothetical protein
MKRHLKKFDEDAAFFQEEAMTQTRMEIEMLAMHKEQFHTNMVRRTNRTHQFLVDWQERGIREWAQNSEIMRERLNTITRFMASQARKKALNKDQDMLEEMEHTIKHINDFDCSLHLALDVADGTHSFSVETIEFETRCKRIKQCRNSRTRSGCELEEIYWSNVLLLQLKRKSIRTKTIGSTRIMSYKVDFINNSNDFEKKVEEEYNNAAKDEVRITINSSERLCSTTIIINLVVMKYLVHIRRMFMQWLWIACKN